MINFNEIMSAFQFIGSTFGAQICFKLILIVILSGFIGMERASWGKPAGFRTYALVGMSAVLVTVCGEYYSIKTGSDPSRIPAQLISGIGFLGAGTILRDGFNVKGLTSAASLLMVTCIGLTVGAGLYIGSVIATTVMYIILAQSHKLVGRASGHFNYLELEIITDNPKELLIDIEKILADYEIEVINMKIADSAKNGIDDSLRISGKIKNIGNKNKLLTTVMSLEKVKQVTEV